MQYLYWRLVISIFCFSFGDWAKQPQKLEEFDYITFFRCNFLKAFASLYTSILRITLPYILYELNISKKDKKRWCTHWFPVACYYKCIQIFSTYRLQLFKLCTACETTRIRNTLKDTLWTSVQLWNKHSHTKSFCCLFAFLCVFFFSSVK